MAPLAAQRVNSSAVNAAVSHMLDAQPGPLRCARITCCYTVKHRAKPCFCLGCVECALCAMLLSGFVGFPGVRFCVHDFYASGAVLPDFLTVAVAEPYPRAAFAEPAVPSSSTPHS